MRRSIYRGSIYHGAAYHSCWFGRPAYAHCGPTTYATHSHSSSRGGRHFGVRRPLRYLRYHLDLDDSQSRRVAAVLNRVKLEREQHQIDDKRANQAVAELMLSSAVSAEEVKAALHPSVSSAERLQTEIARGLAEISEILDDDQREQFADLLRDGVIKL